MAERLLVNFFYAHPVGHAIEALHYANGHHAADPALEVAVALNAATAGRAAPGYVPSVARRTRSGHPFLEPCPDSAPALAAVPRDWDVRRTTTPAATRPNQLELFPGMRDYYAASDAHLPRRRAARRGGLPPLRVRAAHAAAARAAGRRARRRARRLGRRPSRGSR